LARILEIENAETFGCVDVVVLESGSLFSIDATGISSLVATTTTFNSSATVLISGFTVSMVATFGFGLSTME
jgi:hypothetical protein